MKIPFRLMVSVIYIFALQVSAAEKVGIFSAAWLEQGCAVIASRKADVDTNQMQERIGLEVIIWMNGFLVGANGICTNGGNGIGEKGDPLGLGFPPKEWLDADFTARELLSFIQKNRTKIKPKTPARVVMAAWYLSAHPKSGDYQKFRSQGLLEKEEGIVPKVIPHK